eukprot:TRINITY_DN516_c0_g1_i1.p1 TRINITY_DN516_c0_g1~~TRINITY_DN516_c0_g1_i1.p1  ORF type:complete len:169 (+),score=55.05 TRINITY_DN516_c0_g1_i1:1117-1623(+)
MSFFPDVCSKTSTAFGPAVLGSRVNERIDELENVHKKLMKFVARYPVTDPLLQNDGDVRDKSWSSSSTSSELSVVEDVNTGFAPNELDGAGVVERSDDESDSGMNLNDSMIASSISGRQLQQTSYSEDEDEDESEGEDMEEDADEEDSDDQDDEDEDLNMLLFGVPGR